MKRKVFDRFKSLTIKWDDDKYLLTFTIFMVIAVFGIGAFEYHNEIRLYTQPLLGLMVISGVYATSRRFWLRISSVAVAIIDYLVTFVNLKTESFWLEVLDISLTSVIFIFLAGAVLVRVFRDGKVNFYRILGSISAYILIGMIWGMLYYLCLLFDPASFSFTVSEPLKQYEYINELSYFSFTTLFTVGFGDISPVLPLARSLATLEGLVGQLYPVILIARLVSLEIESSRRK